MNASASVHGNESVTKRRRFKIKRLETTISATDKLLRLYENKTKMKELYCTEKLNLLKAKAETEERIVAALSTIITLRNV